jgi:hypothetical protein
MGKALAATAKAAFVDGLGVAAVVAAVVALGTAVFVLRVMPSRAPVAGATPASSPATLAR